MEDSTLTMQARVSSCTGSNRVTSRCAPLSRRVWAKRRSTSDEQRSPARQPAYRSCPVARTKRRERDVSWAGLLFRDPADGDRVSCAMDLFVVHGIAYPSPRISGVLDGFTASVIGTLRWRDKRTMCLRSVKTFADLDREAIRDASRTREETRPALATSTLGSLGTLILPRCSALSDSLYAPSGSRSITLYIISHSSVSRDLSHSVVLLPFDEENMQRTLLQLHFEYRIVRPAFDSRPSPPVHA